MADRLKDAEDRLLEAMFAAQSIADDGFSGRVVRRIRRRLWLRRLLLPAAILVGGAIALEPVTEFVGIVARLSTVLPTEMVSASIDFVPQLQTIVLGAMLFGVFVLGLRTINE
jgi:predicted membrane-bound mannosyltransferase